MVRSLDEKEVPINNHNDELKVSILDKNEVPINNHNDELRVRIP